MFYPQPGALTASLVFLCAMTLFGVLRFVKKQDKRVIDYLKLVALVFIIFYWTGFKTRFFGGYGFLYLYLAIPGILFGLFLFLYERGLFIPFTMKKKHILIIVAQFIVIIFAVFYGYQQKINAERVANGLVQLHIESEKHRIIAYENELRAIKLEEDLTRTKQTIEELRAQLKK
jgi:hypothetical protein